MNPQRITASVAATCLLLGACSSFGGDEDAGVGSTVPVTIPLDGDDAPALLASDMSYDFGITDDTITLGVNADLSGPLAGLAAATIEGQKVYWEVVNANGGLLGRQVELHILDSQLDAGTSDENYRLLAQENENGVLLISDSTGSALTADAVDDRLLRIGLGWASQWSSASGSGMALTKGVNYCVAAANGVALVADMLTESGTEPKVAIVSGNDSYGSQGAAGALAAAAALGIEVVYDGSGAVFGSDQNNVVTQLVNSGATIVWTSLDSEQTSVVFGDSVAQGFEASWSGNQPSFDSESHLGGDLGRAFDQYWWHSSDQIPWNGNDSAGMQALEAAFVELRPDLPISDAYVSGWAQGLMVQALIEAAALDGDLTRAGIGRAADGLVVDFNGLAPSQTWNTPVTQGSVRASYLLDVDSVAYDIQPSSYGSGATGLAIKTGPTIPDGLDPVALNAACGS